MPLTPEEQAIADEMNEQMRPIVPTVAEVLKNERSVNPHHSMHGLVHGIDITVPATSQPAILKFLTDHMARQAAVEEDWLRTAYELTDPHRRDTLIRIVPPLHHRLAEHTTPTLKADGITLTYTWPTWRPDPIACLITPPPQDTTDA